MIIDIRASGRVVQKRHQITKELELIVKRDETNQQTKAYYVVNIISDSLKSTFAFLLISSLSCFL